MEKCYFCHNTDVRKHVSGNRWFCFSCKSTFCFTICDSQLYIDRILLNHNQVAIHLFPKIPFYGFTTFYDSDYKFPMNLIKHVLALPANNIPNTEENRIEVCRIIKSYFDNIAFI